MFATPGNLSTGVSIFIIRLWCGDARNVVVVPGYCFANTLAARLKAGGDSGEGMDIRCTLLNMSFSAHADARRITRTVRRLNPRAVMLVHGNEAKNKAFQPLLREALGGSIPIYAPANGTELDLSTVLQSSGAANPRRTGLKRKRSLAENPDDAIVNNNSNCFYNASDPANSVGRLIEEDGDGHNDDVRIDALDADWHLAIERYKRGAGIADKRAHRAGAASRPVDDGLTIISRLYADLSPDTVLVGGSATELRYKNCVDVTLDRTASVVNVSWLHREHA
jgi:hypothetical protein